MKKDHSGHHKPSGLVNPNDEQEGCYAPVDKNGNISLEKKKHFKKGNPGPSAWVQVECNHH